MQTVIANYGGPLGHNVAIDSIGTGVVINFLGELQSADTLSGPWNDVTNTSPYAVSAANGCEVLPRSRVAEVRQDGFGRQQT